MRLCVLGLGLNEEEATQPALMTVTPLCWRLKHGEAHGTERSDHNSSSQRRHHP